MVVQHSTAVRNAALDAIETTIGTAPLLRIRTGSQPANCAASRTGTVLVTITLPSDWMAAASSGSKALAGSWSGTASATGTMGHYEIMDSSGTTCHEQGSVTATGGGGDLTVTTTTVASVGQVVSVTAKTYTASGA